MQKHGHPSYNPGKILYRGKKPLKGPDRYSKPHSMKLEIETHREVKTMEFSSKLYLRNKQGSKDGNELITLRVMLHFGRGTRGKDRNLRFIHIVRAEMTKVHKIFKE